MSFIRYTHINKFTHRFTSNSNCELTTSYLSINTILLAGLFNSTNPSHRHTMAYASVWFL